jgi:two-component system, OmpR family, alkaline phosphatase synthesis response regulator PhoP
MSTRILFVEDEVTVGSTVWERLQLEGYQVDWVRTAKEAEAFFDLVDLAVLDVQLPDGNGFDIAKALQARRPKTPILFLTAMGTPEDRLHGLEAGAKDYITKPFLFRELLLRIKNTLSRIPPQDLPDWVRIGEAEFSYDRYKARRGKEIFDLTSKECDLLKLLYEEAGKVVSRDRILDSIWMAGEYPTPRTIDNFILKLRKIIERDPSSPEIILSVRGVGYQLDLEKKL